MKRPVRIERKRTKGWKAPEGAIYVGRGSKWGNRHDSRLLGREDAVRLFRKDVADDPAFRKEVRRELCGKGLMCWCPPDVECHADVLLEVANS